MLDEDALAVLLDLPDRERIKSRSACRLSGAQIEAGVMPGAADALADHQSLGQRSMIMAAMRVDGEDVRPRAHQQNVFLADMAEQGLAGEFGQLDAQRQIRSGRCSLFISHVLLPRELSSFSFGGITNGSFRTPTDRRQKFLDWTFHVYAD